MNSSPRLRLNVTSLLLTSTALLTLAAFPATGIAAPLNGSIVVAQAAPEAPKEKEKPAESAPAPRAPTAPPQARPQPPAAQPQVQQPQVQAPPPAAPARPAQSAQPQQQAPAPAPAAPRAAEERRPPAPAAQQREERREERRDERANERRPGATPPAPAAQQQAPSARTAPGAAPQAVPPTTAQDRRDDRRDERRDGHRDDPQRPAPSTAQQPQTTQPTAQQPQVTRPTAQQPQPQTAPATAQQPQQAPAASTAQQPNAQPAPAAQNTNPAVVAPPTQARNANEFIRRDGQASTRNIGEVRQERQESRDGNRTIIREQDRTIIREGDRTIIRHNESSRFAIDARNVRTERRGADTETIVERGNGVRIVTVTDGEGRLLRRMRRDQSGRDVIIIENRYNGPRAATVFIQLAPPVLRMPRERYILDAERARPNDIYEVFVAPPIERIEQPYTLDQVRFNAPLRDRMPRVDLDVTFETGSWQLSPEQVDRLAAVAQGLNRAIERNPREVFMIEGHTDAVGQDVDNLSLSDRRAESVAVALTEQFHVPAENLVTQGYGEQYLKVQTDGPEVANRRVAVRRITPLMEQQASTGAR